MSIITNWPKNAVYPDEYKINVAALGESLFDIRQIANCSEVFPYTGLNKISVTIAELAGVFFAVEIPELHPP